MPISGDNCELGACELYLNASNGDPFCRNNGSCINSVTTTTNVSMCLYLNGQVNVV